MNSETTFMNVTGIMRKNVGENGRITGLGAIEGQAVEIIEVAPKRLLEIKAQKSRPEITFEVGGCLIGALYFEEKYVNKVFWDFGEGKEGELQDCTERSSIFTTLMDTRCINSLNIPGITSRQKKKVKNGTITGLSKLQGKRVFILTDKENDILEISLDNAQSGGPKICVCINNIIQGHIYPQDRGEEFTDFKISFGEETRMRSEMPEEDAIPLFKW